LRSQPWRYPPCWRRAARPWPPRHRSIQRPATWPAAPVAGADGQAATGAVVLRDHGRQIAGAALDASGLAAIAIDLPAGEHQLRAAYLGDAVHQGSVSSAASVQAQTTGTPDFGVAIAPASLSLTAGQSGSAILTVTPINAAALSSPMFLTLSCSGIPDESACTFTPQTLEIDAGATKAVTSEMVLTTQAQSGRVVLPGQPAGGATALAVLFPGVLALGGLAWGARRRRFLGRFALLAMAALITVAGATGCNPQYNYQHHGPIKNPATPAGTYTVRVTAQTSNGVTATTHYTTLALTVK
jgi:hypothetical protein